MLKDADPDLNEEELARIATAMAAAVDSDDSSDEGSDDSG